MTLSDKTPPGSGISHSDFYRKKTLEELAREQNVKPVSRFEDLLGVDIWPEEDDVDEFCRTIRQWRDEG